MLTHSSHSGLLVLLLIAAPLVVFGLLTGCETNGNGDVDQPTDVNDEGLTAFEEEHGIGPITERITLEEQIDEQLAARGEQAFIMKCESCHRMENRHVGPPLGDILEIRSPEWVMNFTLNPQQNIREHPVGQQLLQEYMLEMPYQNVDEEEARAILEYLRTEQ